MQVLKGTFGFDSFLTAQEEVITQLLDGKPALAVMPTGSGKSLCYQLPALLLPHFSIVVSPMISLMKDQVMQMQALGVSAAMYHSAMDAVERGAVLTRLEAGDLKLLYVAPETLTKDSFLQNIDPTKIDLLAVDEAHCISIWGHDFRPEYRLLAPLVEKFPRAVRFALTATATPQVRDDICKVLRIPKEHQFVESFDRRNLMLVVEQKQNGFEKLLNFLEKHPGESGLVYCLTRKRVDHLADKLQQEGYSVLPYHAGLSDVERTRNQEMFVRDEVRLIVATIAFGMGINKSNIRFVVHYDLPKNIETYYQEIGRGGRDGLPCVCMLMFSWGDIRMVRAVIDMNDDPRRRDMYHRHLKAMLDYIDTKVCRRIPLLNWFGEKHDIRNCGMCDNCLQHDTEWMDATVQAQKLLSAVARTGEIFGPNHLIDILRGSENKRIKQFHHDKLSVHGIGKDWSRENWFSLFAQLRQSGMVNIDPEHGSVKLNEQSWTVLRGELPVRMPKLAVAVLVPSQDGECDLELFELLRKERMAIARELSMPPYVIASDRSLREMASFFPQSMESLAKTTGMGKKVLGDHGESFLSVILEHCKTRGITEILRPEKAAPPKYKVSKSTQVGIYLSGGHSIHQAMVEFDVTRETILGHIQTYLESGEALDPDILMKASLLDDCQIGAVIEAFGKLGTAFLSPVHQALGDDYSYQELRIIQLYLLAKKRLEADPTGTS
jgi:ATP-dependent DNA helicase RecQ